MNTIFTALLISLIPLVSAHAGLENELPRAYQKAAFADKCVSYYSKPANRKGNE